MYVPNSYIAFSCDGGHTSNIYLSTGKAQRNKLLQNSKIEESIVLTTAEEPCMNELGEVKTLFI